LKVGLVAYRDRGDEYVTKVFDLTDDLDAVHEHLMAFQANGGGDEPESVNEALHVAVHKVNWGQGNALRIIFLVGDAPPHMDYPNDIPYPVTCRKACAKNIVINTIQCGSSPETARVWKEICQRAEGKYVQIAQDGGVKMVSTPFDNRLAEINAVLTKSTVTYGDATTRATCESRVAAAAAPCSPGGYFSAPSFIFTKVPTCSPPPAGAPASSFAPVMSSPTMTWAVPAAADRAGYCAKTGRVASFDLLDSIKAGKVKLEDLKADELPEEMRKMNLSQRKAHLAKIAQERERLRTEALDLDRKRSEYLNRETARDGNRSGFDGQVLEMLRQQAGKHGLAY
jgi:hypothetical protein